MANDKETTKEKNLTLQIDCPLILLREDEIHLWLCPHDNAGDPMMDGALRSLLTAEELSKQARFHFVADRYRYLLTRALVRTVLSRYVPVHAHAWRFAHGPFGRPHIQAPNVEEGRTLNFNLSHSDGLVVLALARNIDIGVDAEYIENAPVLDADHFFSPTEARALRALPSTQQSERFFELWTLKESYVKANGMGLQIPLDSFSFALDDIGTIGFSILNADENAQRWKFWQFQPTGEHMVALCAALGKSNAKRVVCREIAPLQWERPLEIRMTRTSA
jgi:4'-phosphopantetheinyl transferase